MRQVAILFFRPWRDSLPIARQPSYKSLGYCLSPCRARDDVLHQRLVHGQQADVNRTRNPAMLRL